MNIFQRIQGTWSVTLVFSGIIALLVWIIWLLGVFSYVPNSQSLAGEWPAELHTMDGSAEQKVLAIPLVYKTQGIDPETLVKIQVAVDLTEADEDMAVFIERPLRSLMLWWDGIPIGSVGDFEEGVHQGAGNQSLLSRIPTDSAAAGKHLLEVWVQGELYNGGIEGDIFLGKHQDLFRYQQNQRFMSIFLIAILSFGAILNLAVAAFRRQRFEFISLGFLLVILTLYILSRSDTWYVFFDTMRYKILVRHAFASFACCSGLMIPAVITGRRDSPVIPWVLAIGGCFGGMLLLWPESMYWLPSMNKLLGLFVIILSVKWLVQAALKGKWDARVLLLVAILLIVVALSDWPTQWGLRATTTSLFFSAWFIFIVGMCSVLFIRFTLIADRYGQLVMQASDAIIVVTAAGHLKEMNPAAELLFGEISSGVSLRNIILSEDQDILEHHLQSSDVPRREELRFSQGDNVLYLESLISDVPMGEKLLILRDISDRKEIERTLLGAAKMETIGLVAGGIAHDFNNVLTALIGRVELLQAQNQISNSRHLEHMSVLLQRLAHMVRRLMMLSQNTIEIQENISLNEIIQDTLQLARSMLPTSINLIVTEEEQDSNILASSSELEQVMLNLLLNSRDAMPEGGNIWIEVYHKKNKVCLAIEDEGEGVPMSIRNHIWRPFFSTKNKSQIAGVGLSVVAQIIHKHRARISLQPPKYKSGSRFEIQFPPVQEGDKAPRKFVDITLKNRVMVVDDEPAVLDLMINILDLRGFSVTGFADYESAEKAFVPGAFDLLLSDIMLSEKSGIELAQFCVECDDSMQVVLTSGFVPSTFPERHENWGFLSKPFTAEALVSIIRRTLMSKTE